MNLLAAPPTNLQNLVFKVRTLIPFLAEAGKNLAPKPCTLLGQNLEPQFSKFETRFAKFEPQFSKYEPQFCKLES